MAYNLPCDAEGVCMACKTKPTEEELVPCRTCATPWHVSCLSRAPETLASTLEWQCPDCSPSTGEATVATAPLSASTELVAAIRAIQADASLTELEKARRRQELVSGIRASEEAVKGKSKLKVFSEVLDLLDRSIYCSICMQLPERPVTTPCGHNFCLKCFEKWVGQRKLHCANCRSAFPSKFASQPRINSTLAVGIRMAKSLKSGTSYNVVNAYHFVRNEDRPDKAFTTERAKRAGKANACSGQIFVTTAPDHFGPITAEYDPKMRRGVLVGDSWDDRMDCRQWGAHLPHVAGIAGQSDYGAQSVALSGGYEDDEDHGEWFLYTGSGGRDLSGNRRTNKEQSFDQKFEKLNHALWVSCLKGYPVRVVRSHKEKRSSYAPEKGVRYDGVYRIEKCWRKVGVQGFKVCRYLFVRCDNEPAPWTCDEIGDRPRSLPFIKELKNAIDVTDREDTPAWDYDEEDGWKWVKHPPKSRKPVYVVDPDEEKRVRKVIVLTQNISLKENLLKEFRCLICRKILCLPLTTPCAHNFCKPCLLGFYTDNSTVRERIRVDGRMLRAQKIIKKCPACANDISDFLQNPQVNRELMDLIESLQSKNKENIDASNGEDRMVDDAKENSCQKDGVELRSDDHGSGFVKDKISSEEIDAKDHMNVNKELDSSAGNDKLCVNGINGRERKKNDNYEEAPTIMGVEKLGVREATKFNSVDHNVGIIVAEETNTSMVGTKRNCTTGNKNGLKRSKLANGEKKKK